MRIAIVVLIFLTLSFNHVFGQNRIEITEQDLGQPPNVEIVDWVLNVLHGGGGEFDTASITTAGNPLQIGKFTNGGPSIKLDSGIVLSTGKVKQIESINTVPNETWDFNGPFDLDLNKMTEEILGVELLPEFGAPNYTGDAAVLEFVYIPYGELITMTYVFGSEEYEYSVGFGDPPPPDDANLQDGPYDLDRMYDVFGISIDSPTRPFENIALINLPPLDAVSVNSVNVQSNPSLYQANPSASTGGSYGVQFDGFTKPENIVLIRKTVTPCRKYKVKVAIQDFLVTNPRDPDDKGYWYNSGVFLEGGSLIGDADAPPWTTQYNYTNPKFEGSLVEGGCNDLLVTFTLGYESSSYDPYYIPFKIESKIYRDNIVITDTTTGNVLAIDSVTFEKGEIQKTIRISAVNVDNDIANVRFAYSIDPCDKPNPFIGGSGYSGKIEFGLINNEPFSFSVDPKVYSAYCKETIDLTVTDITSGGVDPVTYIWPSSPVPPVDVYPYTVNSSPDYVNVIVKDLCANESTVQIRIDNKPIQLNDIPTISFCKPGMSQEVEVQPDMDFHDFPGYGFSNVEWLSLAYSPPSLLGSGNPFLITYDNNFVEMLYEIKYNVTDVCGAKTTDTLTVDQTGKLDVGNNQYICLGESIDLVNYTPVYDNDPNNYQWFKRVISSPTKVFLGNGNSVADTPSDTTVYYLEIYDKCEENQIDSLTVFVDHFMPQIVVSPSSKEVCPGESVVLTANTANTWDWTPGGATTQSITVTEFDPGVYTYTVTASSDYCLDKQASNSFEVFPQPAAVFSFDPADEACTGEDIQFTYDDDPTGKEFSWDFDDAGATSNLQNPVHAYANEGTYNVFLHVQQYICDAETTFPVIVNPLPSPDFTVDFTEGCLPVAVQFTDLSQDIFPGASYEWTFGDGSTSDLKNPSYVYNQAGWYSIGLSVYNTARCFASVSKPKLIQVNPNPMADFEADPWITTMDDPEITFINISNSDSTLIDFEWEFGDNVSSGEENPVHIYDQAGDYEILMRVETVNGCWDTVIGKVAVTEFVKLYIPSAFTPNGDGLNDCFQIKGTPVTDWNLYIYDRWGGIVWSTHNYETLWCGTDYAGNPVEGGSYVYQITGTDYKLESIAFKGVVTVVK